MSKENIPKGPYRLKINREDFNFSAAHIFINNNKIERLHGHNYHITVEVEGNLNNDFYLIDFRKIKKIIKDICKSLNHRTLIPKLNPMIKISHSEEYVRLEINKKFMQLFSEDVYFFPLPNVSTELISLFFFNKVSKALKKINGNRVEIIKIEITESFGQSASFEGKL